MIPYHLLLLSITVLAMYAFHEAGHWIVCKDLGYKASIKWKKFKTVIIGMPSSIDREKILWGGIIAGAIPIILYMIIDFATLLTGFFLFTYYFFIGCKKDLKDLEELYKR